MSRRTPTRVIDCGVNGTPRAKSKPVKVDTTPTTPSTANGSTPTTAKAPTVPSESVPIREYHSRIAVAAPTPVGLSDTRKGE